MIFINVMIKNIVKNIVQNKWVKLVFSLLIVASAIPTVLQDIENQEMNQFEHYGVIMLGLFYFFQAILDLVTLWIED